MLFPGVGTARQRRDGAAGRGLGVLLGHRIPDRVRDLVMDALGLVTLLIGGLSAWAVTDARTGVVRRQRRPDADRAGLPGASAGSWAPPCACRSAWRPSAGPCSGGSPGARARPSGIASSRASSTASLVFCTGPLTVLGSLNDGLGNGADQLYLKATLDGFAAIAFAATFGWGVAASALTILVVQGSLTVVGVLLGDVLPDAHLAAVTAVGGLMLVGVALRLLRVREIAVADLLPGPAHRPCTGAGRRHGALT